MHTERRDVPVNAEHFFAEAFFNAPDACVCYPNSALGPIPQCHEACAHALPIAQGTSGDAARRPPDADTIDSSAAVRRPCLDDVVTNPGCVLVTAFIMRCSLRYLIRALPARSVDGRLESHV